MKSRFLTTLSALILGCCTFAACGGDSSEEQAPAVSIQTSESALSFGSEASQKTFDVTVNHGWTAFSDDEWVTVSQSTTAAGKGTVTVGVKENTTYVERTGTVTVKAGTERATVTVKQAAATRPEPGDEITCPVEGYSLVWNDEFNEGSELNSRHWRHEVQGAGWVNNELQNYVNHTSPGGRLVTELKDGALQIHCFKENGKIYSGRVYAHENQGWKYGYFEASIKLPKGKGTWPAFWMMPVGNDWSTNPWPKCGEIDIMEEVGVVPNEVSSSIHTQDYNHTKGTQKTHAMTIQDAEGAFHTYGLLWTADEITTYVDGKVQLNVQKSVLGSSHNQWPFSEYPFYVIFNLAWGGSWGGMQGVDESALPVTMEVDYIRVFQK
ncbi:MAG: family 16 glycosylhydrolase [Bacteroidaceae bacterium]|nr:family 16 glycosylhydrolase [Bacteroidaceae bacterium]